MPFVLHAQRSAEGVEAFQEPGKFLGRAMSLLAAAIGVLAAFGWLGSAIVLMKPIALGVPPWLVIGNTACLTLTSVLFAVAARNIRLRSRRLCFFERSMELAIQTVRADGTVESESKKEVPDCTLTMHPVLLELRRAGSFDGWMARVTVGDRCFALACCSTREELSEHLQRLPGWVLGLGAREAERVRGRYTDRWLGRTPEQYCVKLEAPK